MTQNALQAIQLQTEFDKLTDADLDYIIKGLQKSSRVSDHNIQDAQQLKGRMD